MQGSFTGVADYGAFVAANVVFLLIPGPGNLALIPSTKKIGIATLNFVHGQVATLLTHTLVERLRVSPKASRVLEKAAGTFLIAFGLKLVIPR